MGTNAPQYKVLGKAFGSHEPLLATHREPEARRRSSPARKCLCSPGLKTQQVRWDPPTFSAIFLPWGGLTSAPEAHCGIFPPLCKGNVVPADKKMLNASIISLLPIGLPPRLKKEFCGFQKAGMSGEKPLRWQIREGRGLSEASCESEAGSQFLNSSLRAASRVGNRVPPFPAKRSRDEAQKSGGGRECGALLEPVGWGGRALLGGDRGIFLTSSVLRPSAPPLLLSTHREPLWSATPSPPSPCTSPRFPP